MHELETSTKKTWFTAPRMKRIAIGIISVDLFLLIFWVVGSIHIGINWETACFRTSAIFHFLILIHFALGMYITSMEGVIAAAEYEAREKGLKLLRLPFQSYNLLTWIFTALVSTLGDSTLLSWAARELQISPAGTDECHEARILHITFDSLALAVSLITVLWFILFASYTLTIRHQKRKLHQYSDLNE